MTPDPRSAPPLSWQLRLAALAIFLAASLIAISCFGWGVQWNGPLLAQIPALLGGGLSLAPMIVMGIVLVTP